MGVTGRIHSIESFGTLDGPGIRYVLFLQGCGLRCKYCHNPDTWQMGSGKAMDSDEVIADVLTYKHFIRSGGVTLSGGEPLLQPEFVADILKKCENLGIHTALDTAGAVPLSISREAIDAAKMILLDIKALDNDLCKALTGRSNEDTLATLAYCETKGKPVWLRHVLVPGYTLDKQLLENLADYLTYFSCIELVELLPFHKMGEYKWKELRLPYALADIEPPDKKTLAMARGIFESRNLKVLLKD